jgi:hypothetical protein
MPNGADSNGSTSVPLPRRPKVTDVFVVLRSHYGVAEVLLEDLGEAFSRAAVRVVDDVVAGRQGPAVVAYFIARRFDGDLWWKR